MMEGHGRKIEMLRPKLCRCEFRQISLKAVMYGDLADQTEPKADNPREAQSIQERMKPCSEGGLARLLDFREGFRNEWAEATC